MDKNQPLVSILIPNYNKAPYLRETLDSLISQTFTNWECIIVDDQSTDESCRILEEYSEMDSRIQIFRRPNNLSKGGNAARNYAFEVSKGDFINWFDSDDIMNSEFISSKIETLKKYPFLDFVISDLRAFTVNIIDSVNYKSLDLSQKEINYALEALKGNFWIGSPIPMFRKSFLIGNKLFNENLQRGQEAEFFNRILLRNPKFKFVKKSIIYWRLHDESKTSKFKSSTKIEKSILSFPAHYLIIKEFIKRNSLEKNSIIFFNKLLINHLCYLPIISINYVKLFILIYFNYREFPFDFPLKIMGRRILNIKSWK